MTLLTRAASFLRDLDFLDDLGAATAVQVVPAREPGRPQRSWVVRLGHDLYVRSAPGSVGRAGGGRAHLQVDGTRRPVMLAEVAPELHSLLDDAYLAKYGRCAAEKVATVTSDRAAATTFRVRLRRATWSEQVAAAVDSARGALRRRPAEQPCPTC
ncbi:DUF2255 family protein [Krasilnikoviella flava]|uniref:DUF2255 family protein n=1 Tax=Krasilnikoviella flava TaxID=526729 RepID=UPI00159225BA|nr:DUF2255 family protein [Krasilnikoviella flava]